MLLQLFFFDLATDGLGNFRIDLLQPGDIGFMVFLQPVEAGGEFLHFMLAHLLLLEGSSLLEGNSLLEGIDIGAQGSDAAPEATQEDESRTQALPPVTLRHGHSSALTRSTGM